MKRIFGLLTVALSMVALCAVWASAASAETPGVLCTSVPAAHECVSPYAPGTEVTATLAPQTQVSITGLNGELINQCTESTIHFKYDGKNGLEYLSSSWAGCAHITTDATNGGLSLNWLEGTANALLNPSGELFEMAFYGPTGVYGLAGGGIELIGGKTTPQLSLSKAPLVGVSGYTLSNLKMTAKYNLSPAPMYAEKAPTYGVLCKTAPVGNHCEESSRYPANTEFTATLASGTSLSVVGNFGESIATCSGSSIKFKYDGASELKYLSSSFSGCSGGPIKEASAGALIVKFREGSSEPFGGVGQFVELTNPYYGATGTYGLTGDGITFVQGSSPVMEFVAAKLVGVSGSTINGTKMYGKYNLSPTPVYIGEA
jgi:hypothetical protein